MGDAADGVGFGVAVEIVGEVVVQVVAVVGVYVLLSVSVLAVAVVSIFLLVVVMVFVGGGFVAEGLCILLCLQLPLSGG